MKALRSTGAPEPASSPRTVAHAESVLGQEATAFPHRSEFWPVNVCGIWRPDEDSARNLAWVKDTFAALRPHLSSGSYHNFGGSDADDAATRDSFGDVWHRLREVKTRYDPDNVFRHCPNIPPLTGGAADA